MLAAPLQPARPHRRPLPVSTQRLPLWTPRPPLRQGTLQTRDVAGLPRTPLRPHRPAPQAPLPYQRRHRHLRRCLRPTGTNAPPPRALRVRSISSRSQCRRRRAHCCLGPPLAEGRSGTTSRAATAPKGAPPCLYARACAVKVERTAKKSESRQWDRWGKGGGAGKKDEATSGGRGRRPTTIYRRRGVNAGSTGRRTFTQRGPPSPTPTGAATESDGLHRRSRSSHDLRKT